MIYFLVAIAFFILGNVVPKIKIEGLNRGKQDSLSPSIPKHKSAPPPPRKINLEKRGHLKPEYYGYTIGSYANVNNCSNCKVIGLYEDLHEVNPCPICGGKVVRNKAHKWGVGDDGLWQWIPPGNFAD